MAHYHHLLAASDLDAGWVRHLFSIAADLKNHIRDKAPARRDLAETYTGLLFYENSTRTKASFKMAANRLGGKVMTIETAFSSVQKGETLVDTVKTLEAMGYHFLVLRSDLDNAAKIAASAAQTGHIINAGDGINEHPTQALTDAFTLMEKRKNFKELTMLFVGDMSHSRVARSGMALFKKLGVGRILACAPANLAGKAGMPEFRHIPRLDEALPQADVIYTLRIQLERHKKKLGLASTLYKKNYGITAERLAKKCKKNVLVFHAGPMNVDLEIDREAADGPHSCVLDQVANGVPVRMAALLALHENCH